MKKIRKNVKFSKWLIKNGWTMTFFSEKTGISYPVIVKVMNLSGSISLDIALKIEKATNGEVSVWDMSKNAEAIKSGKHDSRKKNKDIHEQN